MRFWTASGNSVSRRYKEQRSRRPSSSRMRIWSQVWSWFPVSHAAKSQVPKMSAKQQACDRAGNAQGANGTLQRRSSNLLVTEGPDQSNWWPADLGVPSSLGAQNEVRYAYFPATRRLAIDINGKVTVYDTQDHQISGFSQQQPGSGSLSFSSQLGGVDVSRLPAVSGVSGTKTTPEPMRQAATEQLATTSRAAAAHEDILAAIERLAELYARGVLTKAEFSAKKAELLDRL